MISLASYLFLFSIHGLLVACFSHHGSAKSRLSPPKGAVVVRAGTTTAGEFPTINAALQTLPNDTSHQSIFIYGGTYTEQINVARTAPVTFYGATIDTSTYKFNQVLITSSIPAIAVNGSNDLSGTLRIHKDDFSMYNVNVENGYGPGSQAIALSNYGNRSALYACGFMGYQDTLLANQGSQVYLKGYIEGAVDFIFGRLGQVYIEQNTIALSHAGNITASGRQADNVSIYVLNHSQIVLTPDADEGTVGNVFFGRPWGDYARVVYLNTNVTFQIDPAVWIHWHPDDERIDHVFLAEYNTFGIGTMDLSRPNFTTLLNSTEAATYNIATTVGSDYATWVDESYLC